MITIYTKPHCSACVRAKNLMRAHQISFVEMEIGKDVSLDVVREQFPGVTSVPIILNGPVMVGGYVELVNRIAENSDFGKLLLNE